MVKVIFFNSTSLTWVIVIVIVKKKKKYVTYDYDEKGLVSDLQKCDK